MTKISDHYLTRDEAIKFIRRHRNGRQCYIRSGAFLYTQVPDEEGKGGKGFSDMGSSIPVGAKVAMKWVFDTIRGRFLDENCRIHISLYDNCLFIG